MTTTHTRPSEADEKPRLNAYQSEVRQTLTSTGWRLMFEKSILPIVRGWRSSLIWMPDMDPTQRLTTQKALAVLWEGVHTAYEDAKLTPPEWLTKEFEPPQ